MYSSDVCRAARAVLSPLERHRLEQEACRRGCSLDDALLAVAMESLQQQLYAIAKRGQRLVLVKG